MPSNFNPIIGMLYNQKDNLYHPIVFTEAPLPGPPSSSTPIRHKSKMHHTGGFPTRDEAVANITDDLQDRCKEAFVGEPKLCLEGDFEWDGEGVPTVTAYFKETSDGVKLVMS